MKRIALVLLAGATLLWADDETDFSAPPPGTWQRLNPIGLASFNFSAGDCRISSPAPSAAQAQITGPARAALLAPTIWTQCVVVADLVTWTPTTNRSVDGNFNGVLARVQNAGLATTDGYALSVIDLANGTAQLQIYRLDNEVPTLIAGPASFPFSTATDYRLVLVCAGSNLTGRVFDTGNLNVPAAEVATTDATYAAGRAGIVVSSDHVIPIDTTFDDFLAWDGTPPKLAFFQGPMPGTAIAVWPMRRGLAAFWERSPNLTAWADATPTDLAQDAPNLVATFPIGGTQTFFRRRLLGTASPAVPASPASVSEVLAKRAVSSASRAEAALRRKLLPKMQR